MTAGQREQGAPAGHTDVALPGRSNADGIEFFVGLLEGVQRTHTEGIVASSAAVDEMNIHRTLLVVVGETREQIYYIMFNSLSQYMFCPVFIDQSTPLC